MRQDVSHLPSAVSHISKFDISGDNQISFKPSDLGVNGDDSNVIFSSGEPSKGFKFIFSEGAKNCRIFIGNKTGAVGMTISINASNCIVYFGDRCSLKKGSIAVCDDGDAVIVGNGVTTMSGGIWTTGHHSGVGNKFIIVGDDCMFSSSVTLRASDGHPVFRIVDMKQINAPVSPLVIEPHCWIGQGSMILKNVKIGACSIVAAGAVVTKSCRRYSLLSGVPAIRKDLEGLTWSRNQTEKEKEKSLYWCNKFPPKKLPLYRKIIKFIKRK